MKVLHVVEEISKKNHSVVTVSKIYSSYKDLNKKTKIVSKINLLKIRNFLIKYKPDILHVHGMWRPIQIIFIINAKLLRIPIILQPHGMLLDSALKTKPYLKYLTKLFIIFFYKNFIKNISFIAVTNQERKSILKFYKKCNIKTISNPFYTNFRISKKIEKVFSFFGRINNHKNLELIIMSFIKSNIAPDWSLHIYGIDDDKKYKKECISLINKYHFNKRIKFKKPIFENNLKLNKMSKSFLNILMSKSEILNLSVLESLSVGTKSIVSTNIEYPNELSKLIYFTKPNQSDLSKKIYHLSLNKKQNSNSKEIIIKKFNKIYSFKKIEQKYLDFLRRVVKK